MRASSPAATSKTRACMAAASASVMRWHPSPSRFRMTLKARRLLAGTSSSRLIFPAGVQGAVLSLLYFFFFDVPEKRPAATLIDGDEREESDATTCSPSVECHPDHLAPGARLDRRRPGGFKWDVKRADLPLRAWP